MKSVFLSFAVLIVAVLALTSLPAFAQQSTEMTDEHIARIKANCQSAKGTLSRIHAYDAPTYINRNQTYFSISDKMMAQLNSRLALNRLDASTLVKTASNFNEALSRFRNSYKQYDDSMTELLHMDCTRQPVTFYDKVRQTKDERQKVNDTVAELKKFIDQYQQDVETFAVQNAEKLTGSKS